MKKIVFHSEIYRLIHLSPLQLIRIGKIVSPLFLNKVKELIKDPKKDLKKIPHKKG